MPAQGCMRFLVENADEFVRPLAEVEREAILNAMIMCAGNLTVAAQRLEISRDKLYRKLEKYAADEASVLVQGASAAAYFELPADA